MEAHHATSVRWSMSPKCLVALCQSNRLQIPPFNCQRWRSRVPCRSSTVLQQAASAMSDCLAQLIISKMKPATSLQRTSLSCVANVIFSSSGVVSRAFCAMRVFDVLASSSSLGYLCAKSRFFRGLHCWASPWKKSRIQSINQSPSLFDAPGTEAFAVRLSLDYVLSLDCVAINYNVPQPSNRRWIHIRYSYELVIPWRQRQTKKQEAKCKNNLHFTYSFINVYPS